jgi:hypothetical protein
MNATLEEIRQRVSGAMTNNELGTLVENVELQEDTDEFGMEFLRVIIKLKPTNRDIGSDLEHALSDIEDAIAPVDERYPSVRFLDAA